MRTIFGIVLIVAATSGSPAAVPTACSDQPAAVKSALATIGRAAAGTLVSMDDDPLQAAQRTIEAAGMQSVPCLLEIYRHGLSKAGLWDEPGPEPQVRNRLLPLIAKISPQQGLTLYREQWRDASAATLTKATLEARIALLGAREFLPSVTAFLATKPPVLQDEEPALNSTIQLAIDAIVSANHAPALESLRDLQARGWKGVELPVNIAQLSGDIDTIRSFLDSPRLHSTALLALKRLGKDDALSDLAKNPNYRYREAAQLAIAGKLGR